MNQLPSIIKRDSSCGTLPTKLCTLCNKVNSRHHCAHLDNTGLAIFDCNDVNPNGNTEQRRCGIVFCVECMERIGGYESTNLCPFHHPDSKAYVSDPIPVQSLILLNSGNHTKTRSKVSPDIHDNDEDSIIIEPTVKNIPTKQEENITNSSKATQNPITELTQECSQPPQQSQDNCIQDSQRLTQDSQRLTQDSQGLTQDSQGLTQDSQGLTQDSQCSQSFMFEKTPRNNSLPGGNKHGKKVTPKNVRDKRFEISSRYKTLRKISVGCRVAVKRGRLYQLLQDDRDKQKYISVTASNDYHYFGHAMKSVGRNKWEIKLDAFPDPNNNTVIFNRTSIELINPDAELELKKLNEEECSRPVTLQEALKSKKKRLSPKEKSIKEFLDQGPECIKTAKSYTHIEGNENESHAIQWTILGPTEYIEEDSFQFPTEPEIDLDGIDLNDPKKMSEIFFDYIFADTTGHAKKIDEYLADPRCSTHRMARERKIKFHDEDASDPDWKVKLCYKLMISACTEYVVGADNLWKSGKKPGSRHDFPDYKKYLPYHEWRCFHAAAPYAFCDKSEWFKSDRDKSWNIFTPAVESYNNRRKKFFKTNIFAFIADESMSGLRPKTSKTGGLPFITHEPRKPVSLGTLLRNCAEVFSGVLLFQDINMQSELQYQKVFSQDVNHMPDKGPVSACTAEVLRQVQGVGAEKKKSWIGGDAWFGSIETAVETKIQHDIDSTWVIKQNEKWFSKKVLKAILDARYGINHTAGHWVVMTTKISGVELFVCAYAWNSSSVAYFVSTCGKTVASTEPYVSKYEDGFGNLKDKTLLRPSFCDFFYFFCPVIDDHNRARQFQLRLEKLWVTKDPWFRLITTLLGQSVVDHHRLYLYHNRYHEKNGNAMSRILSFFPSEENCDEDDPITDFIKILDFADALTSDIDNKHRKRKIDYITRDGPKSLERITDKKGRIARNPTKKQKNLGRVKAGSPIKNQCYICRMWDKPQKRVFTSFRCKKCHMPICMIDRSLNERIGQTSCLHTHLHADKSLHYGCTGEVNKFVPGKRVFIPKGESAKWKYNFPDLLE